jgi:hypothetical protein
LRLDIPSPRPSTLLAPVRRPGIDDVGHPEDKSNSEALDDDAVDFLDGLYAASDGEDELGVAFVPDARAEMGEDGGVDFAWRKSRRRARIGRRM